MLPIILDLKKVDEQKCIPLEIMNTHMNFEFKVESSVIEKFINTVLNNKIKVLKARFSISNFNHTSIAFYQ